MAIVTLVAAIIAALASMVSALLVVRHETKLKRRDEISDSIAKLVDDLSKFHAAVITPENVAPGLDREDFYYLGTRIEFQMGILFGFESEAFKKIQGELYKYLEVAMDESASIAQKFKLNPEFVSNCGKIIEEATKKRDGNVRRNG